MKQHMERHTGKQMLLCVICGEMSTNMNLHFPTYTGHINDDSFTNKQMLKYHENFKQSSSVLSTISYKKLVSDYLKKRETKFIFLDK